jgi:hypothetical protein
MRVIAVRVAVLLVAMVVGTASVQPSDSDPSGGCIAYGDDWAFMVAAPDGWVVSCETKDHEGVPVGLWPKGSNWADAEAVMYINPSSKPDPKQTLEAFAEWSDEQFRKDKPGLKVSVQPALETADKSHAVVHRYTGDSWANVEVVAFVESKTIFAIIVLSARSDAKYQESYPAFEKVVRSYAFMNKTDKK